MSLFKINLVIITLHAATADSVTNGSDLGEVFHLLSSLQLTSQYPLKCSPPGDGRLLPGLPHPGGGSAGGRQRGVPGE